jgi:hypothetical protein
MHWVSLFKKKNEDDYKKVSLSWAWWYKPVIPALGRLK